MRLKIQLLFQKGSLLSINVFGQTYCPVCNQCPQTALLRNPNLVSVEACSKTSFCQVVTSGTTLSISCERQCVSGATACLPAYATDITGPACPVCSGSACPLTNTTALLFGMKLTQCNTAASRCKVCFSFFLYENEHFSQLKNQNEPKNI
jgi:hypothetical protein